MSSIKDSRVYIKDLTNKKGENCCIYGWVNVRRDHGKLIFLDIRDETGLIQVVVHEKSDTYELLKDVREEWVLCIEGEVKERPDNMKNPDIVNGDVELKAESVEVLNKSGTPPFPLDTDGLDISEEIRMQYRYLDLRRDRLQKNIRLRSEFVKKVREVLFEDNFVEIETPLLTQSTPEGARDFIVPSRLHKGNFFALPQSPQQYKQLLMTGGFEKYFQIARCLRDEDLRADRGFEHTQVDIEMSFVSEEDVRAIDEEMMIKVYESLGAEIKEKPFPIFTYEEAMEKFKADKFDLRDEKERGEGVLAFAWVVDFPFFEKDKEDRWTFTHNPFSMPKEEYIESVMDKKDLEKVIAHQYDLVCNGYEIGSGSIRNHNPEILKNIFSILGYQDKDIEYQFGHMLKAFSYGAPPHGGIAHGVERLLMLLTNEEYLREVQAFPQTSSGKTSVMNAPSILQGDTLSQLGVSVIKNNEDKP